MNACFTCGHQADDHTPTCTGLIATFWGDETCGCTTYEQDFDQ